MYRIGSSIPELKIGFEQIPWDDFRRNDPILQIGIIEELDRQMGVLDPLVHRRFLAGIEL